MGRMYAEGMAEFGEMGLRAHLASNFFPPLPNFVVESTIEGINKFNAGEITEGELAKKCYLVDFNAVQKYHGPFLEA